MAPFTAIFSHLIGGQRVTNSLTTLLCLAPLVGAALGTAVAPLCLRLADSPLFSLVALPAGIAVAVLVAVWRGSGGPGGRCARAPVARRDDTEGSRHRSRSSRPRDVRGGGVEGGEASLLKGARPSPGERSVSATELREPLLDATP